MVWGTISSLGAFAEGVGKVLNYPLLGLYEFMVLPGRKTNIEYSSPQMSVHSKISPNSSDRTYVRGMYWILLSRKIAENKYPWAPTSLTGDANGLHHG